MKQSLVIWYLLVCAISALAKSNPQLSPDVSRTIDNASKVFLLKDSDLVAVDELVAQLRAWNKFEIVKRWQEADLVVDLEYATKGDGSGERGLCNLYTQTLGSYRPTSKSSQLMLVISGANALQCTANDPLGAQHKSKAARTASTEAVDRLVKQLRTHMTVMKRRPVKVHYLGKNVA